MSGYIEIWEQEKGRMIVDIDSRINILRVAMSEHMSLNQCSVPLKDHPNYISLQDEISELLDVRAALNTPNKVTLSIKTHRWIKELSI